MFGILGRPLNKKSKQRVTRIQIVLNDIALCKLKVYCTLESSQFPFYNDMFLYQSFT